MGNMWLKVEKGERVGVVGMRGGGKWSLVRLIGRFYDVRKG